MGRGHSKGSGFEREICKLLGLWWTNGERDDIFWRSSNSGGRAKIRSRAGQGTFGQYGDVQATDPIGQPLIDLCTIECKRGYGNASFGDMLDRFQQMARQPWELWVGQVLTDQKNAGRPYWMLITKRDRRDTLVFLPWRLYQRLNECGAKLNKARPYMKTCRLVLKEPAERVSIFCTTLREFTRLTTVDNVRCAAVTEGVYCEQRRHSLPPDTSSP